MEVTVWFILFLAVVLTIISLLRPNPILSVIGGASWFLLLAYTRTNPFPSIPTGGTVDTIFIYIYVGMALMIWINQIRVSVDERNERIRKEQPPVNPDADRYNARSLGNESAEQYQERLQRISARKK